MNKPSVKAAQRIVASLCLTEHQVPPMVAIIEQEMPQGWQSRESIPPNDGVDAPLFFMSRGEQYPLRGYYKDGWRDTYGKLLEQSPDFWMQIPALPATPITRFKTRKELRDAFIVPGKPST